MQVQKVIESFHAMNIPDGHQFYERETAVKLILDMHLTYYQVPTEFLKDLECTAVTKLRRVGQNDLH